MSLVNTDNEFTNESPWKEDPWNELTPGDYEMLFKIMYGICTKNSKDSIDFIALLRAMKQSANFMASSKKWNVK